MHLMILNQSSSELIHRHSVMQYQCIHLQLNMDGPAEHLIKMEAMLGGQLFKRIGPLLPLDGQCPKCIQIYFYEEHEATKW